MNIATGEDCVFLETCRTDDEEHRSWLFLKPEAELICRAQDDPAVFFRKAEEFRRQGLYLAGWFAYEFGYLLEPALGKLLDRGQKTPLAWLGVFREPLIFSHENGKMNGPWPEGAGHNEPAPVGDYQISNLRPSLGREAYTTAIARIKRRIESGDTYQVNFTLKLLFDFSGSPASLYQALRRNQSVAYGACIHRGDNWILSLSPELFFKKTGEICQARPMKGTIRRGLRPEKDEELKAFLKNDEKNRSENVMIVDLLRNDLGRVCAPGQVTVDSLFDIETYETLHQMTSTISGRLRPGTGMAELFAALFPCGSVTGAPKIRTMEIIHELESEPRGVYTGAIGFISPDGEAIFNVPIRTIELEGGRGEMGIGSGIIYDSDPEQEWRECLLKGRFLSEPAPDFHLIETLLWQPGSGYWLFEGHLARLAASARHLCFSMNEAGVRTGLAHLARDFSGSPMRVRLTLAKDGGLELAATPCPAPAPLAWPPATREGELPRVIFSEKQIAPDSSWLYHKTTRRELYDAERQRAVDRGFYEVLFTNTRGEVSEGSISSVFILRQGELLTPPVTCGLLPGVFRDYLLKNSPLPAREAILTRRDLENAEAVFVGNSVRGLVKVEIQDSEVRRQDSGDR